MQLINDGCWLVRGWTTGNPDGGNHGRLGKCPAPWSCGGIRCWLLNADRNLRSLRLFGSDMEMIGMIPNCSIPIKFQWSKLRILYDLLHSSDHIYSISFPSTNFPAYSLVMKGLLMYRYGIPLPLKVEPPQLCLTKNPHEWPIDITPIQKNPRWIGRFVAPTSQRNWGTTL